MIQIAIKITVTIIKKDTLMLILTTEVPLDAAFGSKSTSKEYFRALKSTICCEICCTRSLPSIHLSHQNDSTGDFCRQGHSATSTQEMKIFHQRKHQAPSPGTRCDPVTPGAADRVPWLLLHLIPGKPQARHEERLRTPVNHKWWCLKWKQTVPDMEELFKSPYPYKPQSIFGSCDKY